MTQHTAIKRIAEEVKHTPGAWVFDDPYVKAPVNGKDGMFCNVLCTIDSPDHTVDETHQNGMLAAMAPWMLHLIKTAIASAECFRSEFGSYPPFFDSDVRHWKKLLKDLGEEEIPFCLNSND